MVSCECLLHVDESKVRDGGDATWNLGWRDIVTWAWITNHQLLASWKSHF